MSKLPTPQLPMFPNFDPPPPERRVPADLSRVSRTDVDAVHARAARADELGALLKAAPLGKAELAIARQLFRLTLADADVTWLELVVDACTRHGVLLEEVIGPGHHTGPVKHARDQAFYVIRSRTGRSFQAIGRVFRCNHTTVSAGAQAHEKRQREAAAAAPAPVQWVEPDAGAGQEAPAPPSRRRAAGGEG